MKCRYFVFLALILLGGCAGGPTQSGQLQPVGAKGVRPLEVGMFCSTHNEEAGHLFNKALGLAGQGNLEEAARAYRSAIELDGDFCDAMDNLGRLLRRQGKIDEAIYWYKRSIEVFPNNTVAHGNLAVAYSFQGKYTEAISEYQIRVKIDPEDPEGYYGLGMVYLDTEKLELALEHFKKAEELYAKKASPVIVDARYNLGVTYYRLRDYKMSRRYLEQVYDQMRNDPQVNYSLGVCCIEGDNDLSQAKKYLKRARELGAKIPPELIQKVGL
jgi:tetratricopeptide (TPR) repeat protein